MCVTSVLGYIFIFILLIRLNNFLWCFSGDVPPTPVIESVLEFEVKDEFLFAVKKSPVRTTHGNYLILNVIKENLIYSFIMEYITLSKAL